MTEDYYYQLEDAVKDALNILGKLESVCPACKCEGCQVERYEAISILQEAIAGKYGSSD